MSATAPSLRKPVLGGYQPDASGRCLACGRARWHLCSAGCRLIARQLMPRQKRTRRPEPKPCEPPELPAMTRHLSLLGKSLYGSRWRRATARALRVDSKTISRWMAGQRRPTVNDVLVLLEMVRQQIDDLREAHRATLNALPGRPYDPDMDGARAVLPTRNASKRQRQRISEAVVGPVTARQQFAAT
jgi:hypothetical protein